MKNYSSLVLHRALLLMMIFLVAESLRVSPQYQFGLKGKSMEPGDSVRSKEGGKEEVVGMKLYATGTGSSLPDCSHACGPCFPCKRVMVSFKCSTESCPIVYRCMCKGKYYHVPSN
ncbi:hypothetical protein SLE2022_238260 [Rubroshorea leprosula]